MNALWYHAHASQIPYGLAFRAFSTAIVREMADDLETEAALSTLTKEELEQLAEEIDPDVSKMAG